MDPSGVDDLVDLASEINKHGWRAVGETVRGTRGTITQKWCSGTYAW
jgi:hypothetical protein